MNIHQILNEFDDAFGRKRKSLRVSHITGHDIMLSAVYEEDVLLTKDNRWPNEPEHSYPKVGQTADQYIMIRLTVYEKYQEKKPGVMITPTYGLKMRNDEIYINSFTMSDYKLASEFFAARDEWARRKGVLTEYETFNYIGGVTRDIDLGSKLRQQTKKQAEHKVACMLRGAHALANPKSSRTDIPVSLNGNTNRDKSLDAMYMAERAMEVLLYLQQTEPVLEKTA